MQTEDTNFDEFNGIRLHIRGGLVENEKAYTGCVPYLMVVKNDLYLNVHCLINHVNKHNHWSIIETTEKLKQ